MKWLITGGCGFIGRALVRRLRDLGGQSIRIVDNLSVGSRGDLSSVTAYTESEAISQLDWSENNVELIVGDILDEKLAIGATRGADIVVHLAANTGVGPSVEDPRSDCLANVLGTFNYLDASRLNGISRFIFASSGAPIGETQPPIHEEIPPHPVSPYGASKLAGEGYCSAYKRTYGLDTVCLRFGNVYGPWSGHKNSVVAKFVRLAIDQKDIEIYGDGRQTRDFIFIEDLVKAIELSSVRPNIGGEVFQIATSRETTVQELVDELGKIFSKFGISTPQVKNTSPRVGDVNRNFSDTTKAREILGWKAETDLRTGLEATVEFFLTLKNR